MAQSKILIQAVELRDAIAALERDRNSLRGYLSNPPKRDDDSAVSKVLKDALANKKGWRDEARKVLGLFAIKECIDCGNSFPTGGKQKLRCGKC